jgi:RHS repeat-associated protein
LKKFFREGGTLPEGSDESSKPGKLETLQFFYHPDHLGSSSFITDVSGEVYQHVQYFPFGETFVEERTGTKYTPYLYNGKELDEETGLYYYHARYYDPRISMFYGVDPLAEKGAGFSPYLYCFNNPLNLTDPDGKWPNTSFGYRVGAGMSYGSGGFAFNITASIGVQYKNSFAQVGAFATGSAYTGGNQLGTSSMTRGVQYDATLTGMATLGGGSGQSHNMYSVNYNMASPFTNDFKNSASYGQALNYNSAVNAEWDSSFGNEIQRSGLVGAKLGNFSFQTSNDTRLLGGDGGDRANTGAGVFNLGGVEFGYQNFTGAYNRRQENYCNYGCNYEQTDYQKSLNQSFYFLRNNGISIEGGPNNGGVQRLIHSVTDTGLFSYPGNFRLNVGGAIDINQ